MCLVVLYQSYSKCNQMLKWVDLNIGKMNNSALIWTLMLQYPAELNSSLNYIFPDEGNHFSYSIPFNAAVYPYTKSTDFRFIKD